MELLTVLSVHSARVVREVTKTLLFAGRIVWSETPNNEQDCLDFGGPCRMEEYNFS